MQSWDVGLNRGSLPAGVGLGCAKPSVPHGGVIEQMADFLGRIVWRGQGARTQLTRRRLAADLPELYSMEGPPPCGPRKLDTKSTSSDDAEVVFQGKAMPRATRRRSP